MFPAPRFMFSNLPMHRAARSIWKRYARLFKPPHFVEKRMGAYWLLDQHSLIDRLMFCQGFYEEDQMARLIALAKALGTKDGKPLFLDIGSHAGLYAILLSKTGVFAKVIAFEPLEENLGQLRANLFLNDLAGTIDLREYALSDAAATLRFANGPQDNRGMGGVASADAKDIIMIEAKRGDDVIETRGGAMPIVLWAVDAHGTILLSEGQALAGLGLVAGQIVGMSVFELYADSPDALEAIRNGLKGEPHASEVEVGGRNWSNRYFPRTAAARLLGIARATLYQRLPDVQNRDN